jgi:hypothetical protein
MEDIIQDHAEKPRTQQQRNNRNRKNKTGEPKPQTAMSVQKKKPCRFFNDGKGCNRGDQCKFVHVQMYGGFNRSLSQA